MTVRLARIDLYPIKSLDAVSVEAARVLPAGALENDRRFALFDGAGKVINGKRTPLVHLLNVSYDESLTLATIGDKRTGSAETFDLLDDRAALEATLTEFFGIDVTLRENAAAGFPDDTLASGPTVIAAETLAEVAGWFGRSFDETRRRFRANLVLEGGGAFWDDRLFGPPGATVTFRIGEVLLFGTNPCARCVVPSRDPETGVQRSGFAKEFSQRREQSLPDWADRDAFDHHFRLAVNTRLYAATGSGTIRVGDSVELVNEA